jgi:aminoglycoside phosphotransferase (APT) family kinase protein
MSAAERDVRASLERMGLADSQAELSLQPLAGGVSSRILRVMIGGRRMCFKQALAKLNVAADWYAPLSRNLAEANWIKTANEILPGIAPTIVGEDPDHQAFVMDFLEPKRFPVWKAELQAGRVHPGAAVATGRAMRILHSRTAGRSDVARRFSNAEQFRELRIEPYLNTAARAHPSVSKALAALAERLAATTLALVHGDIAPKNILLGGSQGIVLLDAECATYGDPAFDVAFCLTHLLYKALAHPPLRADLTQAFQGLLDVYREGLDWEPQAAFDARLSQLLPALMLARIDGKSPLEYLSAQERAQSREFCLKHLQQPPASAEVLRRLWMDYIF